MQPGKGAHPTWATGGPLAVGRGRAENWCSRRTREQDRSGSRRPAQRQGGQSHLWLEDRRLGPGLTGLVAQNKQSPDPRRPEPPQVVLLGHLGCARSSSMHTTPRSLT